MTKMAKVLTLLLPMLFLSFNLSFSQSGYVEQEGGLASDFPDSLGKLMDLDSKFSALSKEVGAAKAFAQFFEEGATLSVNGGGFLHGLPAIVRDMEQNGTYTLTWRPLGGYLASGSPMGYTYGRYVLETQDFEGKIITSHGKYVSIWRKQNNGQWKVNFDMGNSNIPPFEDPLN